MEFDLSPFWISIKTALVATGLAFVSGIAAAWGMLMYTGRWKGLLDGILTLPLILPPTVVGFLLLLLLGRNGPVGGILARVGITIVFSWSATVIASTIVAFPLMYKTVLGAFRQVDTNLLDCSRTLGASETRVFWQLLLPLAWPGVIAGTILAFARALGEFGATLMLAGSIPGRTKTMPIAIFFAGEAGHLTEALVWTIILGSIALSAIATINYLSVDTLTENRWVEALAAGVQRWFTLVGHWHSKRPYDHLSPIDHGNDQESACTDLAVNDNGNNQESARTGLVVDLEKSLPGLEVTAQFTARDRPLAILGASGAGKSTILRCVAGLMTPTTGRIVLNGRVLFDAEQGINLPCAKREVGFVFQNYALFPHMRVARNIGFGLQDLPRQERRARVQYYLEVLQLQDLETYYPRQLSGGQQQRVALARALATNPKLLLLDEPLSALDSFLRDRVEKFLVDLFATYSGTTLLVTHKLEEAYRLCDHWLVLSKGEAIAHGRREKIFEHPPTYAIAQLTECKNISSVQPAEGCQGDYQGDEHTTSCIRALDWNNCVLKVTEPLPELISYVGIRANHLRFLPGPTGDNVFPCWLVSISETPYGITLYVSIGDPQPEKKEYHLQAEVSKEMWLDLKQRSHPWWIQLDPLHLILMTD